MNKKINKKYEWCFRCLKCDEHIWGYKNFLKHKEKCDNMEYKPKCHRCNYFFTQFEIEHRDWKRIAYEKGWVKLCKKCWQSFLKWKDNVEENNLYKE